MDRGKRVAYGYVISEWERPYEDVTTIPGSEPRAISSSTGTPLRVCVGPKATR